MKNWEVEAILKFYKDIDLDIKVTGEWLERYESVYDTAGQLTMTVCHTEVIQAILRLCLQSK